MTRAQVSTFLYEGAKLLGNEFGFGIGRITEFNSDQRREMPYVWVEEILDAPEFATGTIPFNNWQCTIHIAYLDKADSIETEYECLVNKADLIARKLLKYYNDIVNGSKLVLLTGAGVRPFRKKHAQCLTGVILTFTLNMPDQTNLCL